MSTALDYGIAFIGLYGLLLGLPVVVWMTQSVTRILLLLALTVLEGLWLYYQWGILLRADDWPLIRTAIIIAIVLMTGTYVIRLVRDHTGATGESFASLMMRNSSDDPHPTDSANPNNL